jgi:hypothetical protein
MQRLHPARLGRSGVKEFKMEQALISNKTDAEIRAAVKSIFGSKNARVTRSGEIHVKGTMPDTNGMGWYLLGFTGSSEIDDLIWHPDGSLNTSLAQ